MRYVTARSFAIDHNHCWKGANPGSGASMEAVMSEDKRDVLDVLRYELNFIEQRQPDSAKN